jgi:hypothetical protein
MTLLQIATFALGVPLGLLVVGSALFWAGAGFRSQSNAGPSQDRVEDLLGTERDSDGVPWALLASDRDGRLEFAGPVIFNPPRTARAAWMARMAGLALAKPPLRGLRQGSAQWLRPELRVRLKHLKAKGALRHATVKQLIPD